MWDKQLLIYGTAEMTSSQPVSSKAKINNKINLVHTSPPVYTPMYFVISHVVFFCFMSSLLCVHAATYYSPYA